MPRIGLVELCIFHEGKANLSSRFGEHLININCVNRVQVLNIWEIHIMKIFFLVNKIRRFLVFVFLFHLIKSLCDIFLPNAHVFNLIRGKILGFFFDRCGNNVAIASGCIINCPWNLSVDDDSYLAHRCWINASAGLRLGKGVVLSPNVVLATTSHARVNGAVSLRTSRCAPVTICDGVWVASNSVVTKGSYISEGVIVGACSVVRGELSPNCFYAGNPAIFIKDL